MIDFIDIFDVYQHGKITGIGTLQADTDRRLTNTGDKLRDLEQRYERMALVTNALWQLLKAHTGLTDADLKKYIEKVDLADGVRDGKVTRSKGAIDCPHCSRRVLKSASVCAWCGGKVASGDPFHST
jgi:hypothetical protein